MKLLNLLIPFTCCLILSINNNLQAQKPSEKEIPTEVNSHTNPFKNDPISWKKGAKIYKKVCWICHGNNGLGNGPDAAELENKPADFNHQVVKDRSDGALHWLILEGGNGMEPFKEVLNDEQVWHMVSYIRKLQTNQ